MSKALFALAEILKMFLRVNSSSCDIKSHTNALHFNKLIYSKTAAFV